MIRDLNESGWWYIALPLGEAFPLERLGVQALDENGDPTGDVLPFAEATPQLVQDPLVWQQPLGYLYLSISGQYPVPPNDDHFQPGYGYAICVNAAHGVRLSVIPEPAEVVITVFQPPAASRTVNQYQTVLSGTVEPAPDRMEWYNSKTHHRGDIAITDSPQHSWVSGFVPLIKAANPITITAYADGCVVGTAEVEVYYQWDAPRVPHHIESAPTLRIEAGTSALASLEDNGRLATFYAPDGQTSSVELSYPDCPSGIYGWFHALTRNFLWLPDSREFIVYARDLGRYLGPHVWTFEADQTPLPTALTLVDTQVFGPDDTRCGPMYRLASGRIITTWTPLAAEHVEGDTYRTSHYFPYRDLGGQWQELGPVEFLVSGGITYVEHSQSFAQHPADGSLWYVFNRDSSWYLSAVHFAEDANGLSVDWAQEDWMDKAVPLQPDGEHPPVTLVPDPYHNDLLLAYTGPPREALGTQRFDAPVGARMIWAARPCICRIAADGTRTWLPQLDVFVERCYCEMALVPTQDHLYLAVVPRFDTHLCLYRFTYATGEWSLPTVLGEGTWRTLNGDWIEAMAVANPTREEIVCRLANGPRAVRVG
jgi:hypothetical protein